MNNEIPEWYKRKEMIESLVQYWMNETSIKYMLDYVEIALTEDYRSMTDEQLLKLYRGNLESGEMAIEESRFDSF